MVVTTAKSRQTVPIKISKEVPAYGTLLALNAARFSVAKSVEMTGSLQNEMVLYVSISLS